MGIKDNISLTPQQELLFIDGKFPIISGIEAINQSIDLQIMSVIEESEYFSSPISDAIFTNLLKESILKIPGIKGLQQVLIKKDKRTLYIKLFYYLNDTIIEYNKELKS